MTSYPTPPSKRAFYKDYYLRRNYSTKQRISDKLGTHNCCSVPQYFSEGTTSSSAHPIESIATGKFCKDFKTSLFNNLYWQSVVFGSTAPFCRLSGILDRNFGSICGHIESKYFKQSETVENILPKFSRMTHEGKKTNSEQSTKDHEVSFGMVHVRPDSRGVHSDSSVVTKRFKTRSIQATGDDTAHENGIRKSAFVPVGCNTSHSMRNNALLHNLKLGEKRKLQSLAPENFVSGLLFNDRNGKRFKPDETQSIYKRNGLFNEVKQPLYVGEKSIYYNPSFEQNSSSLNGISKERELDLNSNTVSNVNLSKHLFRFNPKKARNNQEETRTSNLQTSPVDLENNLMGVGEAESMRHGVDGGASFSKNVQKSTSVEGNDSREFISLDSTRSSFLSQIKKMREAAGCKAIPCPFCTQTFSKYPDLKIHVQTHKYANISGNGTKGEHLNQSRVPTSKNSMLTPVSSPALHSMRSPSRRLSTGDDRVIRATSVIQFAQKKKKENARNY